jgi:hypothetical protein
VCVCWLYITLSVYTLHYSILLYIYIIRTANLYDSVTLCDFILSHPQVYVTLYDPMRMRMWLYAVLFAYIWLYTIQSADECDLILLYPRVYVTFYPRMCIWLYSILSARVCDFILFNLRVYVTVCYPIRVCMWFYNILSTTVYILCCLIRGYMWLYTVLSACVCDSILFYPFVHMWFYSIQFANVRDSIMFYPRM